jgi:hypothetical protein
MLNEVCKEEEKPQRIATKWEMKQGKRNFELRREAELK